MDRPNSLFLPTAPRNRWMDVWNSPNRTKSKELHLYSKIQAVLQGKLLSCHQILSFATAISASTLLSFTALPAHAVTQEQLLYLEAWRAVDRAYVDKSFNDQNWFKVREDALKKVPMASRKETYEAIRSMLSSLQDPFTRLLEPDQYSALQRATSGSATGIGVEVSFDENGALVVVAPTPGGPADRAGIQPGDQIIEIDGAKTEQLSLYAVGGMLQGPEGSEVKIKFRSAGALKEQTLTRAAILYNPVDSALCASNTAYIRISSFSAQTPQKVVEAVQYLKKAGASRFVLDLRNNGGGSFPAGVSVARMWINQGDIVLIADAQGVRDIYEADGSAIEPVAPLTILVNRGTASASEVLAGAMKDQHRASIAGEKTFGKGLIQTLAPLSDGSAVAVTVAKYQTPAGIDINKVGITPDTILSAEQLEKIPVTAKGYCAAMETLPVDFFVTSK